MIFVPVLKDKSDKRDHLYKVSNSLNIHNLPDSLDNSDCIGNIEDQGRTGSCVANAVVSAMELLACKQGVNIDFSRLFLYYNLRDKHPELRGVDAGSYLRDGFKVVKNLGICEEKLWQFDKLKVFVKPDERAYTEALHNWADDYKRIEYPNQPDGMLAMKEALFNGNAIIFSMSITQELYELRNDKYLEDQDYQGLSNSIGMHAMHIVGYDDILGGWIVENSWGIDWADQGRFLLKYTVFSENVEDVWVCGKVIINSKPRMKINTSPESITDIIQEGWWQLRNGARTMLKIDEDKFTHISQAVVIGTLIAIVVTAILGIH